VKIFSTHNLRVRLWRLSVDELQLSAAFYFFTQHVAMFLV